MAQKGQKVSASPHREFWAAGPAMYEGAANVADDKHRPSREERGRDRELTRAAQKFDAARREGAGSESSAVRPTTWLRIMPRRYVDGEMARAARGTRVCAVHLFRRATSNAPKVASKQRNELVYSSVTLAARAYAGYSVSCRGDSAHLVEKAGQSEQRRHRRRRPAAGLPKSVL